MRALLLFRLVNYIHDFINCQHLFLRKSIDKVRVLGAWEGFDQLVIAYFIEVVPLLSFDPFSLQIVDVVLWLILNWSPSLTTSAGLYEEPRSRSVELERIEPLTFTCCWLISVDLLCVEFILAFLSSKKNESNCELVFRLFKLTFWDFFFLGAGHGLSYCLKTYLQYFSMLDCLFDREVSFCKNGLFRFLDRRVNVYFADPSYITGLFVTVLIKIHEKRLLFKTNKNIKSI